VDGVLHPRPAPRKVRFDERVDPVRVCGGARPPLLALQHLHGAQA
jgi:hypothetical protein